MTDLPHWIRAAAWGVALVALFPAVRRIVARRARHLDPLWAVAFLLVLNRLSWVFRVSPVLSHSTGVVLALLLAGMSWWYQRVDKEGWGAGIRRP